MTAIHPTRRATSNDAAHSRETPARRMRVATQLRQWLLQPTRWWETTGVFAVATALYVSVVTLLGGFQTGDASETVYPSILMAHGQLACAYPASNPFPVPMAGPGYAVWTAAAQWLLHLGYVPAFPSPSAFGVNCSQASGALAQWLHLSGVYWSVIHLSVLAWIALALSAHYLLGATGLHGRRQAWIAPLALAVTPAVFMAVQEYFHPQDQLALALVFVAVGASLRQRFALAGTLFALAFVTQQYTSLALVVVAAISFGAERRQLLRSCAVALAGLVVLIGAFLGATGVRAALLGTGHSRIKYGTWMYELHLPEVTGLVISRVLPLVLAGVIASWAARRRRDLARDPEFLLGVLAVAFSLRVLLEINLFGYYLLATAATLVLRDVVARRSCRGTIWLMVAVLVAFPRDGVWQHLWASQPTWFFQVVLAPSAFTVSLLSLLRTMRGEGARERLAGDHASVEDAPSTARVVS